jgi:hypothetical protein
MRIALEHHGEVGLRAGRILLAERNLTELGLVDRTPRRDDPRLVRADDLSGFDVAVTDAEDPEPLVRRAAEAGISCVVWQEITRADHDAEYVLRATTLLAGANLASGIAPSLVAHETARGGTVMDQMVAWTEPGRPLRRGEPLPFPEPVGARWGRPRPASKWQAFAAPVSGEWAGAIARVTSATDAGVITRIVGVADLATHLEALALAAGALAASRGAYPSGLQRADAAAEPYLAEALNAGLGVASYSRRESAT